MPSFWIFILLILCCSWSFFHSSRALLASASFFSWLLMNTNTLFTAALLAQAFSTSWFWRVCNERYQEVHVYYMCMSISTLRTHGLSLVSSFHFIVDLPSFTCLQPLRKFRPDTMWLIKDNIKSIASVRLFAVLILPQL